MKLKSQLTMMATNHNDDDDGTNLQWQITICHRRIIIIILLLEYRPLIVSLWNYHITILVL